MTSPTEAQARSAQVLNDVEDEVAPWRVPGFLCGVYFALSVVTIITALCEAGRTPDRLAAALSSHQRSA